MAHLKTNPHYYKENPVTQVLTGLTDQNGKIIVDENGQPLTLGNRFIFTYRNLKPHQIMITPSLVERHDVYYYLPFVESNHIFQGIIELLAVLIGCEIQLMQNREEICKIAFNVIHGVVNNPKFIKVQKGFLFVYNPSILGIAIYTSSDKHHRIDYYRHLAGLKTFSDFNRLIELIALLTGTTAKIVEDEKYSIELV